MSIHQKALSSVLFLACAAWLSGCMTSSNAPSVTDVKSSDSTAAAGTANLNGALDQLTSDQFQYGKGNLDSLNNANSSFQKALQLNPNNSQANLGAALTGVLLAAQSPGLSSQLNNTVGVGSPLNMDLAKSASSAQVEVLRKVAAQANSVAFSQIQDTVASVLLPALAKAITELQVVYNDPTFSMTLVTDGKARRLGHPEAAILLAGFKATHALATLLLSYDYDIDQNGSYTYLDTIGNIQDISNLSVGQKAALTTLTNLLSPGSPFLAVRASWTSQLAGVDGEMKDALNVLQAGLASVKTEGDTESNEILHLCSKFPNSNCIEDADFNNALADLDTASKYISQPYAVTTGAGSVTGDTVVHVNFAAFFSVQDYKKMLPYYAFYTPGTWDSAHPVIYFTNSSKTLTANIDSVANILNNNSNLTPAQEIAKLKNVIVWQDPTFQGFLPGATSASIWDLLQKNMESNQSSSGGIDYTDGVSSSPSLKVSSLMSPNLALSLLGH